MNRFRGFLPAMLTGFVVTVFAMAPDTARAADAPVQLVRTGDHAMTCQALAAEINTLAQPRPMAAVASKPKKKGGFGFLRALGSAVPMVGMVGGGMGSAVMSSAAGAAQGAAMDGQMQQQMDAAQDYARSALAGPGIEEQRKDRLTAIFEEKKC